MSIPRISLWTPPYDMPLRLATDLPFRQSKVPEPFTVQAHQIQNEHRVLKITPGAMYILSSVAGRRIIDRMRWMLLDGLRDVLAGETYTQTVEHQDLLDATFGEILGALCTVLCLEGDAEIIRLVEGNGGKSPDFFIIEWLPEGGCRYHLLECKGSVQDVHNINARVRENKRIDLCKLIRERRDNAREQLESILESNTDLTAGATVSARRGQYVRTTKKRPFPLAKYAATINAAVVCIPDGRIPVMSHITKPLTRDCCSLAPQQCIGCVTASNKNRQANALVALFKDRVPYTQTFQFNHNFHQLLLSLKKINYALWARHLDALQQAIRQALVAANNTDNLELQEIAGFLVVNALEGAIDQGMTPVRGVLEVITQWLSDDDTDRFEYAMSAAYQIMDLRPWYTPIQTVDRAIDLLMSREIRNNLPRSISLYQMRENLKMNVEGTLTRDEDTAVFRITTDFADNISEEDNTLKRGDNLREYDQFRLEIEKMINDIRKRTHQKFRDKYRGKFRFEYYDIPINWRVEEAVLIHSRYNGTPIDEDISINTTIQRGLQFGHSWDQYPSASPSLGMPGITAWVARDGRAEIIVRFPDMSVH